MTVLRSLWQAYWLNKHGSKLKLQDEESIDSFSMYYQLLEESCYKLEQGFADFLDKLEEAGWDKHLIILKVPNRLIISDELAD
jgi:FMN phosphatase YigB (HAD superfamily)